MGERESGSRIFVLTKLCKITKQRSINIEIKFYYYGSPYKMQSNGFHELRKKLQKKKKKKKQTKTKTEGS